VTTSKEQQLNLREIQEARELLQGLQKDGFYTMPKITWWILHYEELSGYSYENRHSGSCADGLSCSCSWNSPESRFSDLHSELKEIIDLYQYEDYFKEELEVLQKVREDHPALMKWLKKNEKLGTEDFILFWTEWHEEELNIVKPYILEWQDLEIKFKGEEWKNTIRFCEVFNELYWTSDACPEIEN